MKKLELILIYLLFSLIGLSQESDGYGINLPKFYDKKIHFGFTIAGNSSDFRINPTPNSLLPDTIITFSRYKIKTVYSSASPNFGIGLVIDARLKKYIRLRFTPSLTFAERKIIYTLSNLNRDSVRIFEKSVESVFLIFPLETKIQSKRLGNFSAYAIAGGGYSLDLSARKKAGTSSGGANQLDNNVKLNRDDFFLSSGIGTDFYLQYFKLGFEIKLLIGTNNLILKENNVWTNSIDKVRSRMVLFTITFEG